MSHVLLIRPLEDALPLASQLEARGKKVMCYPLFEPVFFPVPRLKNPQALIITSKNALRALKGASELRDLPLYTVGDETAALARTMGFKNVMSAQGTVQDLAGLIAKQETPARGVLCHLAGEVTKGSLVENLTTLGFKVERHVVYGICDAGCLPYPLILDFSQGQISHVMFFSPRTTELFVRLFKEAGLDEKLCLKDALCLSQDIAEKAQQLCWEKVWISPHPTAQDMTGYFEDQNAPAAYK